MARWGWLGLLALVWGCPPPTASVAPRDEKEAVQRVNDNLARIETAVQYKAFVSFRFRDANERDRQFIGHEASLIFSRPRDLLFDVRSPVGVIAQFGSNHERYWVWVEPEARKLWWGRWETLERGTAQRLPLPPDDLLDVLMLRPLPEALAGGLSPLLENTQGDYWLLYIRLDETGQPSGQRKIRLDRYEPYQPLEIVDRLPDGRVQMQALVKNYRRIGRDGPFTPRNYVVFWPLHHAAMRLDVTRAVFRPEAPEDLFDFPSGWQGEIEQIDDEAALGASRGVWRGTAR